MRTIPAAARALVVGRKRHRLAKLWRITRTDLVQYRFTNHDRAIVFANQSYDPSGAINASALEAGEGLSADNRTAIGAISSGRIEQADLEAGLFRRAFVEEFIIDWAFPWAGALISNAWTINGTSHGDVGYEAELEARVSELQATIGQRYTRTCRFDLGDDDCGIDLGSVTTFVLEVDDVTSTGLNARQVFRVTDGSYQNQYAANFSQYGLARFLTGLNGGLEFEVFEEVRDTGPGHTDFRLLEATPRDIAVGDMLQIVAGCDRTFNTCGVKFDNKKNFGGFPFIPGNDAAFRTLDAR